MKAAATTTVGSETRWRIETGGSVIREWRMKHLQIVNDMSRPGNSDNLTYSPSIGPVLAANTRYQEPGSVFHDFLSDGFGDDGNELGSLLNCNLAADSGLKMEIVGDVAAPVGNAAQLFVMGHRYFGGLSKWQAFKG